VKPEVRLVWEVGTQLGEGPVWCPDEQALWFVDIKGGAIHRYIPEAGACESFATGGMPSFVVPSSCGNMIVGSGSGIYRLENGCLGEQIAVIDMPAYNRTNDATVDAQGRLWFGTMDDIEEQETGAIYCLDRGNLQSMPATAIVTNGPAVSAEGNTLYFVDSVLRRVWRYAITEGPNISSPELFLQLEEKDGHPDGIVLDSEDCLWVALWDGWGVRRYAPNGTLLLQVDLPCSRVTKIAFGGPDLRTAFVTTARVGLNDIQLVKQPLAGGLFAFDAPVAGRSLPLFHIEV
jgi:sugar lactone lactonase YvrE